MSKLYLLDAHALCYRAFYAVKGLVNSKGQPTNAVFGFTNTLKKILKDFQPEHCAVCFDRAGKTFRQEKYAAYKIQRPEMPADLRSQMRLIKQVVEGYHLPIVEQEGYEADDLIATAVETLAKADVEVVIITDDKDLFQLVRRNVKVYSPRKEKLLGEKEVADALGVVPERVVDFIGLAGDSSDNIPGVPGIGKVSAHKLIREFGSLDNIYISLDKVTSKSLREKLTEYKDQAFLSRDLAQLRRDAKIVSCLDEWKVGAPRVEDLYALFTELEFHRFAAELSSVRTEEAIVVNAPSVKELQELLNTVREKKRIYFLFAADQDLLCLTAGDRVVGLPPDQLAAVREIFDSPDIEKITYDIKAQFKRFCACGMVIGEPVFDVMLAGYLINSVRSGHELASLSWQYLKTMVSDHASIAESVGVVAKLEPFLRDELTRRDAMVLLNTIEVPLAFVLARMEQTGVRVDLSVLKTLSDECAKRIAELEQKIYDIGGETFNINSPKQLSHILFEKLKLPVVKKTKTGFSTNEEVLHKLASQHALPASILEYRHLAKLKSTYIDALPVLAVSSCKGGERNIIHTSFNQTVTETGRLSSSNPNLQNIPVRTELGRQIRRAFVSLEDGHFLISADYSQIELRMLAHLSEDENLIRAFQADEDIHAFTAGLMFDCPASKVTSEMRNSAKRVNFGIVYGMSAFGLSKDMEITTAQAQDFIDRYFLRYPKVKVFMDDAIELCRQRGYATTLMNRRRDIPEIVSTNMSMRQFAERQAINTPLQGSAADLMKLAMVNVQKQMDTKKLKSQMILTVHDEIVFDVLPEEEQVLFDLVPREMEQAMTLKIPIRVVLKKGKNWLDMERI